MGVVSCNMTMDGISENMFLEKLMTVRQILLPHTSSIEKSEQ